MQEQRQGWEKKESDGKEETKEERREIQLYIGEDGDSNKCFINLKLMAYLRIKSYSPCRLVVWWISINVPEETYCVRRSVEKENIKHLFKPFIFPMSRKTSVLACDRRLRMCYFSFRPSYPGETFRASNRVQINIRANDCSKRHCSCQDCQGDWRLEFVTLAPPTVHRIHSLIDARWKVPKCIY
jgi:hypothetical protein